MKVEQLSQSDRLELLLQLVNGATINAGQPEVVPGIKKWVSELVVESGPQTRLRDLLPEKVADAKQG